MKCVGHHETYFASSANYCKAAPSFLKSEVGCGFHMIRCLQVVVCISFVMCAILCKCVEKTWNSSSSTTVFTTTCFVFVFPLTAVKTTLFCCSASEWLLMLFRTDCYEVVFFCLPNGKPIKKGAPLMCAIMPFVSYEILLHLEVAG